MYDKDGINLAFKIDRNSCTDIEINQRQEFQLRFELKKIVDDPCHLFVHNREID